MTEAVSDAPINAEDQTAGEKVGDLFENLRELGQALPVNYLPTFHDAPQITAAIVYYLATGSLEPPRIEAPDEAAARLELADQTRENELTARIVELERQAKARDAGPASVAPAPVAEVPTVPTPTPPVAEEPEPILHTTTVEAERAKVDPETATPVPDGPTAPVQGEGGAVA